VGKSIKLENALSYIGSAHKVNFEKLSLKMAFIWPVLNKSFKQEGSGFLDSSVLKEDLDYRVY
jgi:hypothetical protein